MHSLVAGPQAHHARDSKALVDWYFLRVFGSMAGPTPGFGIFPEVVQNLHGVSRAGLLGGSW